MLYVAYCTDSAARAAKDILREIAETYQVDGALDKCSPDAIAIFTSVKGSFTCKHLRMGSIASLEARGMIIPGWARTAKVAIALRPQPQKRTADYHYRFRDAILSAHKQLNPEAELPPSAHRARPRSEWTSGHHARRRQEKQLRQHASFA